jgi:site-specific recombinase XerD
MLFVRSVKLLERFAAVAARRRLSANTIDAYRRWIRQFIRFSAIARA